MPRWRGPTSPAALERGGLYHCRRRRHPLAGTRLLLRGARRSDSSRAEALDVTAQLRPHEDCAVEHVSLRTRPSGRGGLVLAGIRLAYDEMGATALQCGGEQPPELAGLECVVHMG